MRNSPINSRPKFGIHYVYSEIIPNEGHCNLETGKTRAGYHENGNELDKSQWPGITKFQHEAQLHCDIFLKKGTEMID